MDYLENLKIEKDETSNLMYDVRLPNPASSLRDGYYVGTLFISPYTGEETVYKMSKETIDRMFIEIFEYGIKHSKAITSLTNRQAKLREAEKLKQIKLKEKAKKKLMEKKLLFRKGICVGCRHNYYNFGKPQSTNGDVAVAEDYACWSLESATKKGCSSWSRQY